MSQSFNGADLTLTRLPGEIRNQILRYVLVQEQPLYVLDLQWTNGRTEYSPVFKCQPAITQTCSLLRVEGFSIYYGENAFVFGAELHLMDMHEIPEQLLKWRCVLGDNARHLRDVELAVNCEILGPKTASHFYRDFWEILRFRVTWSCSGGTHYLLQGDPTFDRLCICDLDQYRERTKDCPAGLLGSLLDASRLFFRTTELRECENCARQRLCEVSNIDTSGLMCL